MLAAALKKGKPVSWSEPLRGYLGKNFQSSDVDKQSGSIQRLNNTRDRVVSMSKLNDDAVHLVKSYLRMLGCVQARFPVTETDVKVNFTWYDTFKPSKKFTHQRIAYEKACVLFNLAAIESFLGMKADRTQAEGLKKACTHFQAAAGLFQFLITYIESNPCGPVTLDMSPEGLSMLSQLMLGQAQACFFEKAVRSKMQASVLTKLAAQARVFYAKALSYAASPSLVGILEKEWTSHLDFQTQCFAASSEYQFSKVQFEQAEKTGEGYGLRIAWLDSANKKCANAISTARATGLPESMLGTVLNLQSILLKEYNKAVDDNNTIYMDRIPKAEELGLIPAHALAKPTEVAKDLYEPILPGTNIGEDAIFTDLVPAEMQMAEATYKSKLTALVQSTANAVSDSASTVRLRLAEANLPAAVEAGDTTVKGVPDSTWAKIVEQVQDKGGVSTLLNSLDGNAKVGKELATKLAEVESLLQQEARDDAKYRQTWGDRWTIMTSEENSADLKKDIMRYKGLLTEATDSDGTLRRKISENSNILDTVSMPKEGLDVLMPPPGAIDEDPKVESLRVELSLLLVKLTTSVSDSEKMLATLVDAVAQDSIVPVLANSPYGVTEITNNSAKLEEIMNDKMAVHTDVVGHINRAVESHSSMLSRVLDKNHAFMASRNQTSANKNREDVIAQLEGGVQIYTELSNLVQEGKKFYQNLSQLVEQLHLLIKDHCYTRKVQQDEMEQHLVKSFEEDSGNNGGGITRQKSMLMSEYVSSAGLSPGSYQQTPRNVAPAFPTQSAPMTQQPQMSMQPQPTQQSNPPGGKTDEQLAMELAQQQLVEDQRRLLMGAAGGGGGGGGGGLGLNADYSAEIDQMKEFLGEGIKKKDLLPFIKGAGGDVQVAVNHYLEAQAKGGVAKPKKKAGGRFARGKKKNKDESFLF